MNAWRDPESIWKYLFWYNCIIRNFYRFRWIKMNIIYSSSFTINVLWYNTKMTFFKWHNSVLGRSQMLRSRNPNRWTRRWNRFTSFFLFSTGLANKVLWCVLPLSVGMSVSKVTPNMLEILWNFWKGLTLGEETIRWIWSDLDLYPDPEVYFHFL